MDDLGSSKMSDWALDTLFYILDTHYNEVLPTIVASNLMPGDELTNLIGDRVVSRLAEDSTRSGSLAMIKTDMSTYNSLSEWCRHRL